MRNEKLKVLAGAVVALLTVLNGRVRAEPYLMAREGAKCNACHTNQSGGGKRTAFAHIHSKDILHDLDLLPIPRDVKAFNGEISQWLSIGSDLRVRNTTVFNDRSSREVTQNEAFRRHVDSNDIAVNEFLLYGQIDLWPDIMTLYVDESFKGGATNREVFGMVHGVLPYDSYVKAGRFFPTFGLRVQDDEAFIRARSGFTFDTQDEGVELGIAPGPFSLATSITNGAPGDKDVQVTVNGYGLFEDVPVVDSVLAGLSFARIDDKRTVAGFYAGANLWKFTYLGELDLINDNRVMSPSDARGRDQMAAYAEIDLLLFDWLNVRGTFDFVKVANDRDATRYGIGLEPFINKYFQPRLLYRANNGPPSFRELNRNEIWVELHFFL